jgi:hypothetical protein
MNSLQGSTTNSRIRGRRAQIRKLQLIRPSACDRDWLRERLAKVSRSFGCDVTIAADNRTLKAQPSVLRVKNLAVDAQQQISNKETRRSSGGAIRTAR